MSSPVLMTRKMKLGFTHRVITRTITCNCSCRSHCKNPMMPMVKEEASHGRRAGGHGDNLPTVSSVSTGTEATKIMS